MPPQIAINGIVIIVGNYGSGKTEVAINLAVDRQAAGQRVRVADLDLVNPYFRTREARRPLEALGIEMVLPPEGLLQADLPILVPQVAGLIRDPGDLAILDAGGDDVGATVLAALGEAFAKAEAPVRMLQVVNPFRPNTDSVEGCLAMRKAIETASRRAVTGWIGNAHMLDETAVEHIARGYALMQALVAASGLPLVCMTAAVTLMPAIGSLDMDCPMLAVRRQLVPPWQKPVPLQPEK